MSETARFRATVGGLLRAPSARLTNLTLLLALIAALGSGAGALASGSPGGRWIVIVHGVIGLTVLLLVPWKTRVVRRGLRRRRPDRWASLALAALALVTVATGFGHSTGLVRSVGGQLTMWFHVAAALALVPVAGWHVLARRTRRPTVARLSTQPSTSRRAELSRRVALRAGVLGVVAAGIYGSAEFVVRLAELPGSRRRFTGSYETGSFDPGAMPMTIWLNDRRPEIAPETYRLTVTDAAGQYQLTLPQLSPYSVTRREVLDCTSGWFAEQDWTGVQVGSLLRELGDARSVLVRSATGYWVRLPVDEADSLLLATHVGGAPLSAGHGSPARLVVPGRRGFWWVKWVNSIELQAAPAWWQPPFPLT